MYTAPGPSKKTVTISMEMIPRSAPPHLLSDLAYSDQSRAIGPDEYQAPYLRSGLLNKCGCSSLEDKGPESVDGISVYEKKQ